MQLFSSALRATALTLMLCAAANAGDDAERTARTVLPEIAHEAAANAIANAPVVSQEGHPLRFYDDLVRNRLVAINFVFTSCMTVCPLMGARFASLQTLLGDTSSAGDEIGLISISIDPVHDSPARLAQWAAKLGAKPGWTLVTGNKPDIDTLVKSLGSSAVDPASHSPLLLIVDDRSGHRHGGTWQRLDGLSDAHTIADILRQRRDHAVVP